MAPDIKIQPTGIGSLDEMLNGGIPSGSTVLLAGNSGTGKTILSMQWLFAGFKQHGDKGVYISLTEPVGRLMQNASTMAFYDESVTDAETGNVQLWDLRSILEQMQLADKDWGEEEIWRVVEAIGDLVVNSGAKRVVLDSITALCYRLDKQHLIRQFIFSLGATLSYLDATVVLISEVTSDDAVSIYGVEEFISDGIIKLWYTHERRNTRYCRIIKMRGISFNENPATYEITSQGLQLYPRKVAPSTQIATSNRITTGVSGLDTMIGGGYVEGSSIFLSGASGCGKSTLATQFCYQSLQDDKPCVYVSFEETAVQLLRNAQGYNWDLQQYQQQDTFLIHAISPDAMSLQAHLATISSYLKQREAKVLVLDSLTALSHVFPADQLYDFVRQLIAYSRSLGVTTICTAASDTLLSTEAISDMQLSSFFDQIVMLRYIEIESELKKGIVILKMRGSDHDRRMRQVEFAKNGIEVAEDFSEYEGIMTGNARRVSRSMEERLHSVFLEFLGSQGEECFRQQREKGITLESLQALIHQLADDGTLDKQQLPAFMDRVEELLE